MLERCGDASKLNDDRDQSRLSPVYLHIFCSFTTSTTPTHSKFSAIFLNTSKATLLAPYISCVCAITVMIARFSVFATTTSVSIFLMLDEYHL